MTRTKKDIGDNFEEKVKDFLRTMGFIDVCGGNSFKPGGRQVDAVAGWDDTLFIIECKAKEEKEKVSLLEIIDVFRGRSYIIKNGLRNMDNYYENGSTYNLSKYKKFMFVIATENILVSKTDQKHANVNPEQPIYLWYEIFFDYYTELQKCLGKFAIYQLLGEMRVEPRVTDIISVPALRNTINRVVSYHFSINPIRLLEFACVARREAGNKEEYYQRMIEGNRLKDIRSYLGLDVSTKVRKNQINFFPNNIIIAFFSEHDFLKPKFQSLNAELSEKANKDFFPDGEMGILTFPKKYRTCWVIDGQHRLFSYANVSEVFLDELNKQKVVVTALEDLDLPKQRKIFLDINQEQKGVKPDLIWDIIGDSEPKSPEGIIANTIKKLDYLEPFYREIFIPSRGVKQRGQFSLNSFCRAIEKTKLTEKFTKNSKGKVNVFYSNDKEVISNKLSKGLSKYFSFLDQYFEKGHISGFFTKEIGWITIAIYIYERIISISTKIPDEKMIESYFDHIKTLLISKYNDPQRLSELRGMSSGEGNKDKVVKEFLLVIRENISNPNFNWDDLDKVEDEELITEVIGLESKLRKVIKKNLDKYDKKWYLNENYLKTGHYDSMKRRLIKDQQRDTKIVESDIWNYLDLAKVIEILDKHKNKFENIFKPVFSDFNFLLSILRMIKDIRDPEIHKREVGGAPKSDIDTVKIQLPRIRDCAIDFLDKKD